MLLRINKLVIEKVDFAFETTLSTKSYHSLLKSAKNNGYKVWLLFFWLPNPEMAIARVTSRVKNGGHFIPKDVIIRRYSRGIANLINIYLPLADNWFVLDNSSLKPELIAEGNENIVIQIINEEIWSAINKNSHEH